MKIKQLADRFGSNRINAEKPGTLLKGCTCINIPFAGGMCEVPFIIPYSKGGDPKSVGTANIVNVNDLDRHVINLANVLAKPEMAKLLVQQLEAVPFHPDVLLTCQKRCRARENETYSQPKSAYEEIEWALDYFVCSWMARGGSGGTDKEFEQAMSIRWKSGGGDSAVRFRSATASLAGWQKVMRLCTFTTMDAFDFLAECMKRDIPENGIYVDAPWPEDGDNYKHKFGVGQQRLLADVLAAFEQTRIVVRYGDHPLIRELYPAPKWTWHDVSGRTQANSVKSEVLLTNY